MAETFNVEEVKAKMDALEETFSLFASTLKDVNIVVNDLVNNGEASAIFGDVGTTLLNTWNYNASTFGDFHNNFQNWTEVVSIIAANNREFVVTAESIYASHGGNLDGVQESKKAMAEAPTESIYYTKAFQDEAAAFLATYGAVSNGTTAWLNNYDKLSPEAKKIVDAANKDEEINNQDVLDKAPEVVPTLAKTDAYQVATEGRTAKEMYQDALDLKNEMYTEIDYLYGYKNDLTYSKGQLDAQLEAGNISQTEYNKLAAEFDSRIQLCDSEIAKRSEIYNTLENITANRIGTTDGVLKDAQDFGSNDVVVAAEALAGVNKSASSLTPVGSISLETNGDGTTRNAYTLSGLYLNRGDEYGSYTNNLADVSVMNNGVGVSNLTMKSAYMSAGNNKMELESAPGVYLFSTSNYLFNNNTTNMPPSSMVGIPESSNLSTGTYQGFDSVYDSNTGNYYTYDAYLEIMQGKQEVLR